MNFDVLHMLQPPAALCTFLKIHSLFCCTTGRFFPHPLAFFLYFMKIDTAWPVAPAKELKGRGKVKY